MKTNLVTLPSKSLEHAINYCHKRGFDLEVIKSSNHIGEASKLNGVIVDMRHHNFKYGEIANVVGRSVNYVKAVWEESRA